ncbi:hypothetical protein ACVWZX_003433 [Deinococcus sp. UYEF24]
MRPMANPGAVGQHCVHFQPSENTTQKASNSRNAALFLLAAARVGFATCANPTGTTYFLLLAAMA